MLSLLPDYMEAQLLPKPSSNLSVGTGTLLRGFGLEAKTFSPESTHHAQRGTKPLHMNCQKFVWTNQEPAESHLGSLSSLLGKDAMHILFDKENLGKVLVGFQK